MANPFITGDVVEILPSFAPKVTVPKLETPIPPEATDSIVPPVTNKVLDAKL